MYKPITPTKNCPGNPKENLPLPHKPNAGKGNFLSVLKNDDILLLGLIFILLKEGIADKTLIFALVFIFISGF